MLFDSFEKEKAEQKLILREQRFKSLVQDGSDLIAILDQNGVYKYVAPTSDSVLGISSEEFIGHNALDYIHVEHKGRIEQILATLPGKKRIKIEPFLFKDGKGAWRWLETIITNLLDNPAIEGFIANSRDVTEQIEREQSLRELYQKNRLVLESTADGIYGIDTKGGCTFINKAAANMLGYRSEECIGKNMHQLIHHHQPNGDPYPESECPIFISKNEHKSCRVMDEVFWKADGTSFDVEYTSNPMIEDGKIMGGVVAFSDITVRKKQEKELQESLEEKETLLMEIHHRVKNNLAVISSMIQLQILNVDNEYVQDILNDSIYRIKTMAMIHELLYKSPSFSKLYLNDNIEHLISRLTEAFDGYVKIDSQFSMEHVELNINQAIPCMLMMNEVVTNIIKHGFRGRKNGELSVEMFEKSEYLTLKISDNGVGLPDNFDSKTDESSVGLILIETLANQLDGEYSHQSLNPGALFTLTFKKNDIKGIGNAHL